MPPAPPMFSTTTDWPSSSDIRAATIRPATSIELPAVNETTMVIGRVGYACCAAAGAASDASAAAAAMSCISGMESSLPASLARIAGRRKPSPSKSGRRKGSHAPMSARLGGFVRPDIAPGIERAVGQLFERRFGVGVGGFLLLIDGGPVAAMAMLAAPHVLRIGTDGRRHERDQGSSDDGSHSVPHSRRLEMVTLAKAGAPRNGQNVGWASKVISALPAGPLPHRHPLAPPIIRTKKK